MRFTSLSLLGGVSLAAAQQQMVFDNPQSVYDRLQEIGQEGWEKIEKTVPSKESLLRQIKGLQHDIDDVADELFENVPNSMDWESVLPPVKPHTRKHDSEWDHVVRGADLESLYVTNSQGDREREIDGKLATYDMRIKAVDPSELGVDTVKQYSGYLDDNENDKHLFYWFFESRNDPKNDPVVLWLNGGPGCSSLTGLFLELGPGFINKSVESYNNPFSWNNNASVIFLDQPVNVGYSYSSSSVSTTLAASKDVYALMTLFFKQFPQYGKQDFHIAGESYAGHYIPQFATEIMDHKNRNINLKSVLIGNGLTDPYTQYEYYRPMACGDGGWPAVLDESECQSMDNALPRCQSLIKSCIDTDSSFACVPAAIYCNNALIGPYQRTGKNPYDVRIPCEDGNLCYTQLDWISEYLNKPNVMKALGAEVSSYEGCNFDINRNFLMAGDWPKPFQKFIPGLLEKMPVLIYAGDADFICNWLGNLAWTNELEWPGQKAYQKAKMNPLTISSSKKHEKVGAYKSSGNFTFVRIHAAGHMVPLDQPAASLDMLNRWLDGEWLEKN